MAKNFWKEIAEDYGAPLIHPATYMLGITTNKFKREMKAKYLAPTLYEWKQEGPKRYKGNYCLNENDILKHEKIVVQKLEKTTKYFNKLEKQGRRSIKDLKNYAFWIFRQNLVKCSNKDLIKICSKLFNLWAEMNMWGHLVNLSDFVSHCLSHKIPQFLEKRISEINYPKSVPDVFAILTTPLRKTPFQNQEKDIFKILALIQANKKAIKIFKNQSINQIIKAIKVLPKIGKIIDKYTQNYDWIQFHYAGPTILDKKYFIEILTSQTKQGIDAKEELGRIRQEERKLILEQKKITEDLDLSKRELYWIKVAQTFIFLKALRKDIVFWASRLTDPLINEIGKRLNLSPLQTRYLADKELEQGLSGDKLNQDEINQRILYSTWIFQNGKMHAFTGRLAKKYAQRIVKEEIKKKVSEFKGGTAYPGLAKGRVKIIVCAEDISKMKKGDILVSAATNPNLLPAMKLAAAFITDEGGITCHAAIVAREMKKPCITGTKIATKVLKDGQLVEVDANKGIIKIIK